MDRNDCLLNVRSIKITTVVIILFVMSVESAASQPQELPMDSFKKCLVTRPGSNLGYCIGFGALSKLQSLENEPHYKIADGLTFNRDEKMYRESYSALEDRDPNDYRGILDSVGQVLSRRNMHWDMGFIYPGLAMRIAPSTLPGGQLEFVLDPHFDAVSIHTLKEASTSRILARQFLIPFLMGFKFNVATLVPILFGIIAILAKKAIFFSKIALVLSSTIALSSLLFPAFTGGHGEYGGFNSGFGGGGHHATYPYNTRYPADEFSGTAANPDSFFRGHEKASISASPINVYPEDQLHLYGDINLQENPFGNENGREGKGRNFAWNEHEKQNKT